MSWSTHIASISQEDEDLDEEWRRRWWRWSLIELTLQIAEETYKEEETTSIWCFGKVNDVVCEKNGSLELKMEGETLSQTL